MTTATWPEASTQTEADRRRHAQRDRIRQEDARRRALMQSADALDAKVRELEATINDAADAHQEATAPLQGELSELESAAIKRVTSRRPSDPQADARRAELVAAITVENGKLEAARENIDREKAPLLREAARLRNEAAGLRDESYLASAECGNPALLIRQYGLVQAIEGVQRFRSGLDSKVAAAEHADTLIPGSTRGPRWRAVAEITDEVLRDLNSKLARLNQEIVNE